MSTRVEAVEGVRATLAAIAQAADDGRTDDYIAIFTADAVWDIPSGRYCGHQEIREVLDAIAPGKPQRHMVSNSVIDVEGVQVDAVSDYVFLVYSEEVWVVSAVGRYHDKFTLVDGAWRLSRREVRGQTPAGYMPIPALSRP